MARECRFGQMAENTKVNGNSINVMARAGSGIPMVISMRETGRMINLKDSVYTLSQMGPG
jgi:hypothetical protein